MTPGGATAKPIRTVALRGPARKLTRTSSRPRSASSRSPGSGTGRDAATPTCRCRETAPPRRCAAWPGAPPGPGRLSQHLLDLGPHVGDILEGPVDRGEADVGDLVDLAQPVLPLVDQRLQPVRVDIALLAGDDQTARQL